MSPLQNLRASIHHGVLLPATRLRPTLISVRATASGRWHVTSSDGRFGGTFRTRAAAIRYARDEAIALPRAMVAVFELAGVAASETYDGHARVPGPASRPAQNQAA